MYQRDRSALPMAMHFADCEMIMKEEDTVILASTNKSVTYLYILEALFVRELKPFINTQFKDDCKSIKLRILI